ncbi:uncharacterized protein [Triticum aestivum]|uniref:uncharacterized protein n=1 Tax=Triticum aestivum TaxID=4565 RepID=UPI001D00FF95|nr:uncharacterized protein LOC123188710 [Triticum aestivum]
MLFTRAEYMWGTAKLQINDAIKDRIMVTFPNESSALAYLFYEKIGRICSFCGIMFHNVQGCPLRNQIILERHKRGVSAGDIPSQRFGEWITDAELIPQLDSTHGGSLNHGLNIFQNQQLIRFQRLFADDEKGKGLTSIDGSSDLYKKKDKDKLVRSYNDKDSNSQSKDANVEEQRQIPRHSGRLDTNIHEGNLYDNHLVTVQWGAAEQTHNTNVGASQSERQGDVGRPANNLQSTQSNPTDARQEGQLPQSIDVIPFAPTEGTTTLHITQNLNTSSMPASIALSCPTVHGQILTHQSNPSYSDSYVPSHMSNI